MEYQIIFSSVVQLVKISAMDVPNLLNIHVHIMLVQYDGVFLVWLRINSKMLLSQIAGKAVLLHLQSCYPRLPNEKVVGLWNFNLFLGVRTL